MKAMVLAAGHGTRLYPLTANRPKPTIPVAGVPLLRHLCELLKESGINDVMINCCHQADILEEWLASENLGMNIQFSRETDLLGTAGGVKRVESFFSDTFVVLYGDNLFDVDLEGIVAFHRQKNALVTVALNRVPNPEECGIVTLDPEGRVTSFVEKPDPAEITSNLANAGIYVMEREVLDLVPANTPYDFGRELFPQLLGSRGRVFGFPIEGYAKDIGTPRNYSEVHRDILGGKVNRISRDASSGTASRSIIAASAQIDESATVEAPALIGDGTVIEAGAIVRSGTVLGKGCWIKQGATVDSSIIWDRVTVGEGSRISSSVLAEDCELQERVTIFGGAILGSGCLIERDAVIEKDVKLPPNTVVEEGEIVLHWC